MSEESLALGFAPSRYSSSLVNVLECSHVLYKLKPHSFPNSPLSCTTMMSCDGTGSVSHESVDSVLLISMIEREVVLVEWLCE